MCEQSENETAANKLNSNKFRESFKYYKSRQPAPEFSRVIDFSTESPNFTEFGFERTILAGSEQQMNLARRLGMKAPSDWFCYKQPTQPGLVVLSGLFDSLQSQLTVAQQLLQAPLDVGNVTNLDATLTGGREERVLLATDHWHSFVSKLRWTTLGYHYDWTSKTYNAANHNGLPSNIQHMAQLVIAALHQSSAQSHYVPAEHSFVPETAIVNYYSPGHSLAPHTDHSEWSLSMPLVSFSLGQSALFLVGGVDLDESPLALMLRSGDCVVLAGEQRLVYHAVPRVMGDTVLLQDYCSQSQGTVDNEQNGVTVQTLEYLNTHRINLSVRQVNPESLPLKT